MEISIALSMIWSVMKSKKEKFRDGLWTMPLQLALFVLLVCSCSSGSEEERIEPYLRLPQSEAVVKSAGETLQVQVDCNVEYEVQIPSEATWLSEISSPQSGAGTLRTHSFRVDAHTQYDGRMAVISFLTKSNPTLSARFTVNQMQKDAILVAKSSYDVEPEGAKLTCVVNANVEFVVRTSANWIKPSPVTRALVEKQISFEVEANETGADREAVLTLSAGEIKQTIHIAQKNYERDRKTLTSFYQLAGGDEWSESTNWCTPQALSTWKGVKCNAQGRVVELDLSSCGVKGDANRIFTLLSQLDQLVNLNLGNNALSGTLPDLFESLSQLRGFNIMNNQVTGAIPASFGKLEQLYYFNVYGNSLTGGIPSAHEAIFKRLPKNLYYYTAYNNLTGELPDFLRTHATLADNWHFIVPQNVGYGFTPCDLPAFTGQKRCVDGSTIDLNSYYGAHAYTLLFYWDSDVAASTVYIPRIKALLERYGSQGLGILGIRDTAEDAAKESIYMEQLSSVQHIQYSEVPIKMPVPFFFVVDRLGQILFIGGTDYLSYHQLKQFHANRDELFDFVAQCFGDAKFDYTYYTSTDYSMDGQVVTLQQATQGLGIDLVFLGEAFTDKDMAAGGRYEQKMREAMEQFFAFEPYTSFRNRFNCYAVKVVSANAEFAKDASRAIQESDEICKEYARKAPLKSGEEVRAVVVYNEGCDGRSYTSMYSSGDFCAYNMGGVNLVLNHEVGGHGFGKLADEYVEPGNEQLSLPTENRDLLYSYQYYYGWFYNVDWHSSADEVRWSHLLKDSRYAGEGLGLFEGAYYYGRGAYRPTENSMMRYNDTPFNAPCRELIYKRIMTLSEGSSWSYNYEDFVSYDAKNRNAPSTRAPLLLKSDAEREVWLKRHRAPVLRDEVMPRSANGGSQRVPLR